MAMMATPTPNGTMIVMDWSSARRLWSVLLPDDETLPRDTRRFPDSSEMVDFEEFHDDD
jgi:hypothetical protein